MLDPRQGMSQAHTWTRGTNKASPLPLEAAPAEPATVDAAAASAAAGATGVGETARGLGSGGGD